MSLLVSSEFLRARSGLIGTPLKQLRSGLALELDLTIAQSPEIPNAKAKLTRAGGRCPVHGTPLDFDPFSPRQHKCARCGTRYNSEEHYLWWVMSQHLYLAERAVHGALLFALGGEEKHALFSESLLAEYSRRYAHFPNSDNVLGPTRLFFSTYLESIWLLQICAAADLLEDAGRAGEVTSVARDRIIQPSAQLIATYDEGGSNRQAWNSAALLASAALLGAQDDFVRHAERARMVIEVGLLEDGSWYEGENYHVFAHRGLWYLFQLCASAGYQFPAELDERYLRGFATPFRTMLPDMTMLARRDSQYAVSLRQWRFAESCELGVARSPGSGVAQELRCVLDQLYDGTIERRSGGRVTSTAEAERNYPASGLGRDLLGWKSLLCALPELPARKNEMDAGQQGARASLLMESQGLAIFRRDRGRVMAALDYGHHGGGHGHPDRLNLVFSTRSARWLDDAGTGSYVDKSLFWYRSSLAHNAPMVGWRTQSVEHGSLAGFTDDGSVGFAQASYDDSAAHARFSREVVVLGGHLVDEVSWRCERSARVQLPLHIDPHVIEVVARIPVTGAKHVDAASSPEFSEWRDAQFTAAPHAKLLASANVPQSEAESLDAGIGFVSDLRLLEGLTGALRMRSRIGADELTTYLWLPQGAQLWRMRAPGPPGEPEADFIVLDFPLATAGNCVMLHAWKPLESVSLAGIELRVKQPDGKVHVHERGGARWRVSSSPGESLRREFKRVPLRPADPQASSLDQGEYLKVKHESRLRSEGELPPAAAWLQQVPQGGRQPFAVMGRARTQPLWLPQGGAEGFRVNLGREHFRRSELDWVQHGEPSASVVVVADRESLIINVGVRKDDPRFAERREAAYLDNENPDINSDGVQLHLARLDSAADHVSGAALLLVPEEGLSRGGGAVRVTARSTFWREALLESAWNSDAHGFRVALRLARAGIGTPFAMDVIVNLLARGRERRSGQLVMSGGGGNWLYLAGDRQSPSRLQLFRIIDD